MKIELILGGKKSQKVTFATSTIRAGISITDKGLVSLQFWQRENYGSFLGRKKFETHGMNLQKFEKVSLLIRGLLH